MNLQRAEASVFSPMGMVAALAVCALLGSAAWLMTREQSTGTIAIRNGNGGTDLGAGNTGTSDLGALDASTTAATSSTPLGDAIFASFASRYISLSGTGSASDTAATAADIQPTIAYQKYVTGDIRTDSDTSLKRVLEYRTDMRIALAPLLQNTEPELQIYARYIDSRDVSYLTQLQTAAQSYHDAATLAAKVVVPADAVHYQIGILNAMGGFAAVLSALANNAKDPIASMALLRTYNTAEQDMLNSFNSLALYSAGKTE